MQKMPLNAKNDHLVRYLVHRPNPLNDTIIHNNIDLNANRAV